jgi:hypothetical protein
MIKRVITCVRPILAGLCLGLAVIPPRDLASLFLAGLAVSLIIDHVKAGGFR